LFSCVFVYIKSVLLTIKNFIFFETFAKKSLRLAKAAGWCGLGWLALQICWQAVREQGSWRQSESSSQPASREQA